MINTKNTAPLPLRDDLRIFTLELEGVDPEAALAKILADALGEFEHSGFWVPGQMGTRIPVLKPVPLSHAGLYNEAVQLVMAQWGKQPGATSVSEGFDRVALTLNGKTSRQVVRLVQSCLS